MTAATALIADDEPLLRERLATMLAGLWPELQVVAQARNGREAVELFEDLRPRIAFLDVHMPGLSGVEVARCIGSQAQVVFVTAFDKYAVEAFHQGAIDYLMKPLEPERVAQTVRRLQDRLAQLPPPQRADQDSILERLARELRGQQSAQPARLKWIKASVGASVKLIPVDEVIYLKADNKYTVVAWDGGEALIRKSIRDLADTLDPEAFVQVHRSAIVSLARVSHFVHLGDGGEVHLKGRPEKVAVSRSFVHLFQHM